MEYKLTVDFAGQKTSVSFEDEILLSDALRGHVPPLDLPCAGNGRCGKCRVRTAGVLSPVTEAERRLITAADLEGGVRLACAARAIGDAQVFFLAPEVMENIVSAGVTREYEKKPMSDGYGLAVDIGTTTLTAALYRLSDCAELETVCLKNPQSAFGADVISRIGQSLEGKSAELASVIRAALGDMAKALVSTAGIALYEVDAAVITGNTAMLYLLTGQDADCLSHAPFDADRLFGEEISADLLEISLAPKARVYLPRCISAFVGADITTAILASGMHKENSALLVDIGTNGEIALAHDGKLYACSTAAGPAFEGAGIQMGMNGVRGAIDTVELSGGNLICGTIGNAPATGICGSGIIDAAAALCEAGVLDETGALLEDGHEFSERVVRTESGLAFDLNGEGIMLTQKDVRMIQLAKSAICAGILTLMSQVGLGCADIGRLYIAGGFGSYIDMANAARIRLIPAELTAKAVVIGNAAASGAAMLLQNVDFLAEAEMLAKSTETIELTTSAVFMDNYVDGMSF